MITAQIESFERAIPELAKLFPVHWEELALFKDRMPLVPQWGEYVRRERDGVLFMATVRWDGRLCGYYIAQVAPGFHYQTTLTAHQDIVYIDPAVRGQGLVLPLMRCVQRELSRRGVKLWYAGYKAHNPLQMPAVLKAVGFVETDVVMAKWLGG